MKRDKIVIGTSAGGIETLQNLLVQFPENFPASIFIVIHTSGKKRYLPQVLNKVTPLKIKYAENGESIKQSTAYVAPPDFHLIINNGSIKLTQGPLENTFRPAIDPLFRSAAMMYGRQVIGVILTGFLDDGVSGLADIKKEGGITIVQDPADAIAPDMPNNVIKIFAPHLVLPVYKMGSYINKLINEKLESKGNGDYSELMKIETEIDKDYNYDENENRIGTPSVFSCPGCGGVLWEIKDNDMTRYRCRIGHAYTSEILMDEQEESINKSLLMALRTMEERKNLLELMADEDRKNNRVLLAVDRENLALKIKLHSEKIRNLLLNKNNNL